MTVEIIIRSKEKGLEKGNMGPVTATPSLKSGSIIPHWLDTHSDLGKPDSDTPPDDDTVQGQNAYWISKMFKCNPKEKTPGLICNWTNSKYHPKLCVEPSQASSPHKIILRNLEIIKSHFTGSSKRKKTHISLIGFKLLI